jgi:WD40 repeat protein
MPAPSAAAQQWNLPSTIAALTLNRQGDWVAAALGDGTIAVLPAQAEPGKPTIIPAHDGVSLSLQPDADGHAFLSGGDDGKVLLIDPNQGTPITLAERKGQWIDHVAASPDGAFRAYSAGKQVHLMNEAGEMTGSFEAPSNPGGIEFSPNGKRLAVSHYNGLSLLWTNAKDSAATKLAWKGSHLGAIWHPDGKIVLSSLQDNSLHGWRLADMNEMRMQGYAGKVRSMHFTAKGKYLATSGAEQVICWPFFGGGPWGKVPLTLGSHETRLVTSVAPHPKDELVAAGYDDGMIILGPLDGRMEILIHPPSPEREVGVVGMGWNAAGDCLFAALESGNLLLFTLESVRKAALYRA